MARGTLYHIVTDKKDINTISAADFHGRETEMAVEYFADRNVVDASGDIVWLTDRLHNAGFKISTNNFTKTIEIGLNEQSLKSNRHYTIYAIETPTLEALNAAKIKYFLESYNALKTAVEAMTPEIFAIDTDIAYEIGRHIDNRYSDAVALDTGNGISVHTLARFIRTMKPLTTYYISAKTVQMH